MLDFTLDLLKESNARTEPRPECGGLGAGAAPSNRHDACRVSSSSDLLA
jgi:hypothetical protein